LLTAKRLAHANRSQEFVNMRQCLVAISLSLATGALWAQEGYSAKSLFFGEDNGVVAVSSTPKEKGSTAVASAAPTAAKPAKAVAARKPAKPQFMGASYFVRLKNPDGTTKDVLAGREFKTGERFQLGLKVNRPAYVYIFNEDPSGQVTQIYPPPGRENFIDAMGVIFLPAQGAFEFDAQPGTEQLLVYLTQQPLTSRPADKVKALEPDMVSAPLDTAVASVPVACPPSAEQPGAGAPGYNEASYVASASNDYASKGIAFVADASCGSKSGTSPALAYASKGIVFSQDPAPEAGGQVASYVVKTSAQPDASLFLKIKLEHR
jgi:hypothetical protein